MSDRFDGISGIVSAWVMARMNTDMEKAAITMAEPRDGERFLVVGFGPGIGLLALLNAVTPASVVALDPSNAMVRAARRRLSRHRRAGDVQLVNAPAAATPTGRDFDVAVAVNAQQLWEPHRDSLLSISNALRPGGRLVTLTHLWAITKHHTTVPEWKALAEADLEASGFDPPEWSGAHYRSGPALGLRVHKSIATDAS